MAKCKNCTNLYNLSNEDDVIVGKWCPKINDSPDIDMERECVHYKGMTQADRIRSMSDEELAEWLTNMCEFMNPEDEEPYKSIYNIDTEKEEIVHDSYGSIMDWLQSEVEV